MFQFMYVLSFKVTGGQTCLYSISYAIRFSTTSHYRGHSAIVWHNINFTTVHSRVTVGSCLVECEYKLHVSSLTLLHTECRIPAFYLFVRHYCRATRSCKRCSRVVEVKISSAESFCSTNQFLAHSSSPDTFVIAKASTLKEDYGVVQHACFFSHSVLFLQFASGTWPYVAINFRGVVR